MRLKACGGDARAAVIALLIANDFLEHELAMTAPVVSLGFHGDGMPSVEKGPTVMRRSVAAPNISFHTKAEARGSAARRR